MQYMYFVQIQGTLELFSSPVICFICANIQEGNKYILQLFLSGFCGQTSRVHFLLLYSTNDVGHLYTRQQYLYMLSSSLAPPLRSVCIGRLCLPTQREERLRGGEKGAMINEAEG